MSTPSANPPHPGSSELEAALAPFDFGLPPGLVARHPPPTRDGARLLVVPRQGARVDTTVRELASWVDERDLVVVNDTRVFPARLVARRSSGARIEVLLLEAGAWPLPALVRPGRRVRPGEALRLGPDTLRLLRTEADGRWWVEADVPALELCLRHGHVPLPPYLHRDDTPEDRERYQTVFARDPGSVAAPTAGLHFTPELVTSLEARGARVVGLTLHVGAGTFRPVGDAELRSGRLHEERFSIPATTAEAVDATRARRGRVLAVGTTTARALESALDPSGHLRPGPGVTSIFLRPGSEFRVVDRLWTNFHVPRSSLLMLVAAFAGRERVLEAYAHAIRQGYRFYSYGDASLFER